MKFINLTPHQVVLANGNLRITFEKKSSDPIARVESKVEETTIEHEIAPSIRVSLPVNVVQRTEVYGLPEPQEGIVYIVSSMVATHVKRPDVISPITDATCERDQSGRVLSVKGFQTFTESCDLFEAMAEVAVASQA